MLIKMRFLSLSFVKLIIMMVILKFVRIQGDLEATFAKCCALGANWGRDNKQCSNFPTPIPGQPPEYQYICLTTASICCLRFYRDAHCERGKLAAKSGANCSTVHDLGGEFYKDCCDACKLGLITGSPGMKCHFEGFRFGDPWNESFLECCIHVSSTRPKEHKISTAIPEINQRLTGVSGIGGHFSTPSRPVVNIPDSENLCLLFPGQLCGHVCVPTFGSYICQCREGFTLSLDGKTCIQSQTNNRCDNPNPCEHFCQDTGVSIECSCNFGYRLKKDQRTCEDVDECFVVANICGQSSSCLNSIGSYKCIPFTKGDCPSGFHFNANLQSCLDEDECTLGTHDCKPTEECLNRRGGYECQELKSKTDCPLGYKFDSKFSICKDIDECTEGIHNCSSVQKCFNVVGTFVCRERSITCDAGYVYDEISTKCTDIDECANGQHLCSKTRERCINLPGAYRCDKLVTTTSRVPDSKNIITPLIPGGQSENCPKGYEFDPIYSICQDFDECLANACGEHEFCVNTPGSFYCECKDGFVRHEVSDKCEDVNECQLGLHMCETLQRCDNSLGSYTCTRITGCGTGYTLDHNTGNCEDDDECALEIDHCRQLGPKWKCENTKGSFRCEKKTCHSEQILNSWGVCVNITCTPGYKPHNKKCIDVNECSEGDYPCKKNEKCFNFIGSFECRPKINCGRGYRMNEFGSQCIDVDECEDKSHTCVGNQLCVNQPGGYICQCPSGYRINANRHCEDIDECQTAYRRLCGNSGICENTSGSYRCTCKKGFRKSVNEETCIDANECTEGQNPCDHNCNDVWGSYYCTCRAGYKLGPDKRTCLDVNECNEIRGKGRLCLGFCVNTPGTFKCNCPSGYRLAEDQRTCKDINECDSFGICSNSEDICVNTRGSFRCQRIICPANYIADPNHKNRCKKEKLCKVNDESCLKLPLTYSYNFLPLASNMTLLPNGQVDLFTMRGPLWSSTNVQFDLGVESVSVGKGGIAPATRNNFLLSRSSFNQVVLRLIRSLEGPQEVLLNLNMNLYHNGLFQGSAVAKLLIFVSEYDF